MNHNEHGYRTRILGILVSKDIKAAYMVCAQQQDELRLLYSLKFETAGVWPNSLIIRERWGQQRLCIKSGALINKHCLIPSSWVLFCARHPQIKGALKER